MSMPPLLIPQFFIGRESLKDVWVDKLGLDEKDISHESSKAEEDSKAMDCIGWPKTS